MLINFKRLVSQDRRQFNALDFSQSVDVILVTFSVLVGVSLTDFFDDTKNGLQGDVRWWAFWALVALLLRYIIGSAIHLKHAYRTGPDFQHSASIFLFLKDIAFLIAFGYVAVQITHSHKFFHFLQQSSIFISISLIWSITDPLFRKMWEPAALQQTPLWEIWAVIDAAQLALTGCIYYFQGHNQHLAAAQIAVVYGIFFIMDLAALLRIMALRRGAVPSSPRRKIYLAGPLFSRAEQDFNQRLAAALTGAGFPVFLPQDQEQQAAPSEEIFDHNKKELDAAALVVANMDGPDPDSGTCWECGYAFAKGKPVVAFRTDFRANEEPGKTPYNLMLAVSATASIHRPFAKPDEIFHEIIGVLTTIM